MPPTKPPASYDAYRLPTNATIHENGQLSRSWANFWGDVARKAGRSLTWRGVFSDQRQYKVNDLVADDGGTLWCCLQPNPADNSTLATAPVASDAWDQVISTAGLMADPTTALGDLIVRGPKKLDNLPLGINGQVLTVDATQPLGIKWAAGGGGAGAVSSVFGRTGAVVAASGDYTASQITNAVSTLGVYADPAWITSLAWSKITGAPSNLGLWQQGSGGAIYYNSGNVGIGTSNPSAGPLVVSYPSSGANYGIAVIGGAAGTSYGAVGIGQLGSAAGVGAIQAYRDVGAQAFGNLILQNGGGNVGIGTTSPQVLLDLPGFKTSNSQVRIGTLEIQPYALNNSIVSDNLYYNGSNWLYRNNGYGSQLSFNAGTLTVYTAPSGSAGAIAPLYSALFVKNSGFVGISTVNPSCELHVVGRIMAGSGGYVGSTGDISVSRDGAATTGAIYFGNSSSTYLYFSGSSFTFSPATSNLPSDMRLKQNIRSLAGGIEVINRLRPIEAEWSKAAKVNIGRRVVSLVAQELQEVLPHAVSAQRGPNPGDEEYLAYDPQEIAMQCILAIQQLATRVKQLEGRN